MVDLKFIRIAVSIFDTYPLQWYFRRRDRMERTTKYCDIFKYWQRTGTDHDDSTALFLERLYSNEPNKFLHFLSRLVAELQRYYQNIYGDYLPVTEEYKRNRIMRDITWFLRELETIGVIWNGESFQFSVGTPELDISIRSRLGDMLSKLGQEYIDRYNGATEALMSRNPDNLSQAISSIRELLSMILDKFTENDTFTDEEKSNGNPTRRARIRRILEKSKGLGTEAELADAIANTLDKTYRAMSKGFHGRDRKDWENILYVFKTSEYLIYFILLQSI